MAYTVQSGDTMYTIAKRHGVTVNALLSANPQIQNPNMISPGQIINIPGQNSGQNSGQTAGAVSQCGGNLLVLAAASLQPAAEELRNLYAQRNPNVNIDYQFAASGVLQGRIEGGTPADIFISAGQPQMDALAQEGLLLNGTRKDLLRNELVLIAGEGKNLKFSSFAGLVDSSITRIGIGKPETVPAGMYARETLTNLSLWDKIKHKLIYFRDVRQVLEGVESGDVDVGLVYRSDAVTGENIKTVAVAPAGSHSPIVYPMAILRRTNCPNEAAAFAAFLSSAEAGQVFTKYGFTFVS